MKEKSEGNRLASLLAEQHLGRWVRAKETFPQLILGCHDFLRRALVVRQFANEREDDRHIATLREANLKGRFCFRCHDAMILVVHPGDFVIFKNSVYLDMDSKILETERLILRNLTLDDATFLLELMNEPAFIEYVADRGLRTEVDAARYLSDKILPTYERFGFGFYRVELKESETAIGICGLVKRDTLDDPDIGFSILQRFGGKGYAYEAAVAVLNYGRAVLGLAHICGVTAPGNRTSIHLLEKLGLKFQQKIHLPGYGTESLLFE